MPTCVRTDKCDGREGRDKAACTYICPNDDLHACNMNLFIAG